LKMINEAGQARVGMLEPAKSIWGSDLKNLGIGDKSYDCGAENKLTCIGESIKVLLSKDPQVLTACDKGTRRGGARG
jgi:hypothetical protein